ncbi:hypothetical protein GYMLUDRAFT_239483 [Collybiopsis luxurians FD-317 M1]|nr:hypothetical protein GYMLUDRAFT_239483 [Collybiopsis luxurians FD-317 M1]
MKAITVGVAEYSHLVSAEKVSINPPKSVKKIKFRMFAQEVALTSGALCDGFNCAVLIANAWKDIFSATTKFGKENILALLLIVQTRNCQIAHLQTVSVVVPIYDARGQKFDPEALDENGPRKLPLLKDGNKMVEEGKHIVSFNVQWVVVLATPDDPMVENNVVSFETDSEMEMDGNY